MAPCLETDRKLQHRTYAKGPWYPNTIYFGPKVPIYRDYFKAKVCTIWAHGPLRLSKGDALDQIRYYDPGLGGIPYFGVLGYVAGLGDA